MLQSQLQVGQSSVGQEYLLPAFTAALLGATSIRPGRVNVWGTVLAVAVLAVTVAGLNQLGAPFFVEPLFNGSMLILAVGLAVQASQRRTKTRQRGRPGGERRLGCGKIQDKRRSRADEFRQEAIPDGATIRSSAATGFPRAGAQDDQRGNGNLMTPAKVLEATRLIKTGEIVSLGRPYEANMPIAPGRAYALRMPGGPTGGPYGEKSRTIWNDEFISTEIGQIGTQMDALGHLGCMCGLKGDKTNMLFYNGNKLSDMWSPYGLKKLGMETGPVPSSPAAFSSTCRG